MGSVECEVWSVKFEVWSAKSAVWSVRCGVSREGHGRDRLSLNYRSFMFGKLPPPACPGLCYLHLVMFKDVYVGQYVPAPLRIWSSAQNYEFVVEVLVTPAGGEPRK